MFDHNKYTTNHEKTSYHDAAHHVDDARAAP
jgi:hypothetical protein